MFGFFSVLSLLLTFSTIQKVKADYYASISGLEELIDAESVMIKNLENYIKQIEDKMEIIVNFLFEVTKQNPTTNQNQRKFYQDPLSFFRVIKRLTEDWKNFIDFAINHKEAEAFEHNLTRELEELEIDLPTSEDLIGAVKGLVRLQKTYALKTHNLANGKLLERKYGASLTASDCFQIGRILLAERKDYELSINWLLESESRLREQNALSFTNITKEENLEYLAQAAQMNGNTKFAILLANEIILMNASNEKAMENLELYEQILKNERTPELSNNFAKAEEEIPSETYLYERTCRKELTQTPSQQRELRCRYISTNNVAFCRIAPLKIEELSLDPYVAYYHEIVYESEIEKIIDNAENRIERSKVRDGEVQHETDYRTSKNTWFSYKEQCFLKNLAQRLEDITGLTLETAEPLQIANYGIGGHYGTHMDDNEDIESDFGRRILTALIYINDVELGGATAFPLLRLAVPPIKGSLVLWYNLHESLELDYRTKHAGCPVLKGSKWICNQWFSDRGQEFNRPCSLQRLGYKSIDFADK